MLSNLLMMVDAFLMGLGMDRAKWLRQSLNVLVRLGILVLMWVWALVSGRLVLERVPTV